MANIPIIGNVTISGAAKDISGGYVNIGGVWKPIVKTYVNVNGVWKAAWRNLTTWKKYTVKQTTGAPYSEVKSGLITGNFSATLNVKMTSAYSFNTSTGVYTLSGGTTAQIQKLESSKKYCMLDGTSSGNEMCEYYSGKKTSITNYQLQYYKWTASPSVNQSRGDYVSDVSSEDESAYPDNGVHTDGYWYVKQ